MARKYFEIILLPSSSAQFIKYKVSYRAIVAVASCFALLFVLILLLLGRYVHIQREKQLIAEGKQATHALKTQTDWLESETAGMETKIGEFENTVAQFKRIFGVQSEGAQTNPDAGPGMSLTETRESEQYNAFLYLAKLREEPEKRLAESGVDASDIEARGILATRTPAVRPVTCGFFTSGYGYRIDPFTGKSVHHMALDISAWYWEEVHAPADGLVVRTGFNPGAGRYVEISHGFGYMTRYEHLQKYTVQPGDRVSRNDVIGYVGNTGRSTGPHLHYEVRFAGVAVDPMRFIAQNL